MWRSFAACNCLFCNYGSNLFIAFCVVLLELICALCCGLPLTCAFASNSVFDKAFAVLVLLICNFLCELWELLTLIFHCMQFFLLFPVFAHVELRWNVF